MIEFFALLGAITCVGLSFRSYDRNNQHLPGM